VKDGGEWRFAALHNGRVRPDTIPAPDSFPARVAKLLGRLARAVRGDRARDALAIAAPPHCANRTCGT